MKYKDIKCIFFCPVDRLTLVFVLDAPLLWRHPEHEACYGVAATATDNFCGQTTVSDDDDDRAARCDLDNLLHCGQTTVGSGH
jgi:hypothetical protein